MDKIKVLCFSDRIAIDGGIQKFIIENLYHMSTEDIQVDWLTLDDGIKSGIIYDIRQEVKQKMKKIGVGIYSLPGVWLDNLFDYFLYYKELNKFFSAHPGYKVVHMHSSSKNFMLLCLAKKYKVPIRIAHSHSTNFLTNSFLKKSFGKFLKFFLRYYATHYFACSQSAAEWMFGEKNAKLGRVKIIANGIETEKFTFNEEVRKKIRKLLHVDGTFVIGHVGGFSKVKNHDFLIDVFREIYTLNNNARLLLIGKGVEEEKIRNKVNKLLLSKAVIFAGYKENVHEYLQAMDVFVFPSLFEGLPISLIEAQASGLVCFVSNKISKDAKITELVEYMSLDWKSSIWAEKILTTKSARQDMSGMIRASGYSINDTAKILENFYKEVSLS